MEFVNLQHGDRVELHPATDLWMMGARFAYITGRRAPGAGTFALVRVRPDKALYHGRAARRSYWMSCENILRKA